LHRTNCIHRQRQEQSTERSSCAILS